MKSKTLKTILFILLAGIVLLGTFAGGAAAGYFIPRLFQTQQPVISTPEPVVCPTLDDTGEVVCPTCTCPVEGSTLDEYEVLFQPFWEAWNIVLENYVDQPVDTTLMMQGAIKGMLESLGDKHTSYMTPTEFQQANTSLEGEYEGIGAWVDVTGEYVEVVSAMKGSPAEAAGLRPKDRVIAIDGEDMTGIPGDLALQRILGPAGSTVVLTIQRGEEVFDVSIVRAKITVPVADYEMLEGNVAYVALNTFNEFSTPQLRAALDDLLDQNPVGLILDLRGNGGGYLQTSIEVVSEFVKGGTVVMIEETGDGRRENFKALNGGSALDIPMVVLVDVGSASASEIVAGALQDLGRAKLVGTVTYGKGTVQTWVPLSNDQGGVRVTIARWLTPNGTQISEVGLTPDVLVEYTEEDFNAGLDPQLDAAIELLLGGN